MRIPAELKKTSEAETHNPTRLRRSGHPRSNPNALQHRIILGHKVSVGNEDN